MNKQYLEIEAIEFALLEALHKGSKKQGSKFGVPLQSASLHSDLNMTKAMAEICLKELMDKGKIRSVINGLTVILLTENGFQRFEQLKQELESRKAYLYYFSEKQKKHFDTQVDRMLDDHYVMAELANVLTNIAHILAARNQTDVAIKPLLLNTMVAYLENDNNPVLHAFFRRTIQHKPMYRIHDLHWRDQFSFQCELLEFVDRKALGNPMMAGKENTINYNFLRNTLGYFSFDLEVFFTLADMMDNTPNKHFVHVLTSDKAKKTVMKSAFSNERLTTYHFFKPPSATDLSMRDDVHWQIVADLMLNRSWMEESCGDKDALRRLWADLWRFRAAIEIMDYREIGVLKNTLGETLKTINESIKKVLGPINSKYFYSSLKDLLWEGTWTFFELNAR